MIYIQLTWFIDCQIKLQTCQITMQKLILLGLFLSCFEIQNILGHEHPDWDRFIKKLPLGTWRPLPNPPVTSEGPIVDPPPAPPIQDCWDGNKCQKNSHCGKNGNCRDLKIVHLGTTCWVCILSNFLKHRNWSNIIVFF